MIAIRLIDPLQGLTSWLSTLGSRIQFVRLVCGSPRKQLLEKFQWRLIVQNFEMRTSDFMLHATSTGAGVHYTNQWTFRFCILAALVASTLSAMHDGPTAWTRKGEHVSYYSTDWYSFVLRWLTSVRRVVDHVVICTSIYSNLLMSFMNELGVIKL